VPQNPHSNTLRIVCGRALRELSCNGRYYTINVNNSIRYCPPRQYFSVSDFPGAELSRKGP
jgi:hypothetical protein